MKEKPILFNGEMVRAILEGRKTMTRRVIKFCPIDYLGEDTRGHFFKFKNYNIDVTKYSNCPYGEIGDRLWVRETIFQKSCPTGNGEDDWWWADKNEVLAYIADGNYTGKERGRIRPSIHMPRWASRITLEITNIRVERLKDISEGDARDEGCELSCGEMRKDYPNYKRTFHKLWESINGFGSWEKNPFVWVIEFKKV